MSKSKIKYKIDCLDAEIGIYEMMIEDLHPKDTFVFIFKREIKEMKAKIEKLKQKLI